MRKPYKWTPEGRARRMAHLKAKGAGSARALSRFWKYVVVDAATGCWVWSGSLAPTGYGIFAMRTESGNDNKIMAHRVVYQLMHAVDLRSDEIICHDCDNRLCVNPAHLFVGDQQANMNDMIGKGRAWWQRPHIRLPNGRNAGKITDSPETARAS